MAAEPTITLTVARYRPEQEAEPSRQSYTIPYREDMVVLDALIETKRPAEYDQAVQLLKDLHDLWARSGRDAGFDARLSQLRERHARKPSLLQRLDQAGLGA